MRRLIVFISLFFVVSAWAGNINTSTEVSILSLSDFHFDPYISCSKKITPCPVVEELRNAPVNKWPNILMRYERLPQEYLEDSTYSLLKSALNAASVTAKKNHIETVLVLGDFLAHEYRKQYKRYSRDASPAGYKSFVNKTMALLTTELANAFPNSNVYSLIGNNDSYWGDYRIDPYGWFFNDSTTFFASLVKNRQNQIAIREQMPKGGYYSIMLDRHTRLIALNTVLFSTKAKPKQTKALALQELSWLHQQLVDAKNKKQHVIIAMHIPMGLDLYAMSRYHLLRLIKFWNDTYTSRFEAELTAFAPEIIGMLAGHLHTEWYHQIQVDDKHVIPMIGTPSISPYFGNNPSFKIYRYTPEKGMLENYQTYSYPLNKRTDWKMDYSFNKNYRSICYR